MSIYGIDMFGTTALCGDTVSFAYFINSKTLYSPHVTYTVTNSRTTARTYLHAHVKSCDRWNSTLFAQVNERPKTLIRRANDPVATFRILEAVSRNRSRSRGRVIT